LLSVLPVPPMSAALAGELGESAGMACQDKANVAS
jgi:hypothetical protein